VGEARKRGNRAERIAAALAAIDLLPIANRKIYKYTQRKYAEKLISHGSTRVGTLEDFRREEHGKGISDPLEGTSLASAHILDQRIDGGTPNADALRSLGIDLGPNASVHIVDGHLFNNRRTSENLFVWCFSTKKSRETMAQFQDADTCVEIFDTQNFFNLLAQAVATKLQAPLRTAGAGLVQYDDRIQTWDGQNPFDHPVFCKEKKYAPQHEGRAVFAPTTAITTPFLIIDSSDIYKYCRIVSV